MCTYPRCYPFFVLVQCALPMAGPTERSRPRPMRKLISHTRVKQLCAYAHRLTEEDK